MSLRSSPVEQTAALPDGREALVRVGLPDDSYIPQRELETVSVEVRVDGAVVATVNTLLEPEQESEALALAREIAEGLASGELEPRGGAIEELALRIP